jgi:3-deoxy-D-manno-octulosonic-acid transferase
MPRAPRILILRLSSMGDVILSTAALDSILTRSPGARITWVVSKGFEGLLAGDSRIDRLVVFDRRREGFRGWHRLIRALLLGSGVPDGGDFSTGFDEVIDLHGSLRTRYARGLFLYYRVRGKIAKHAQWRGLSKQRISRLGYFLFKWLWPLAFRPAASGGYAARVARFCALGSLRAEAAVPRLEAVERAVSSHPPQGVDASAGALVCVMPGAAWRGKCLPTSKWLRSMSEVKGVQWVILGRPGESPCEDLLKVASRAGLQVLAAFRVLDLIEQARMIRHSRLLVGNDTGMIHLAEALGVPVVSVFGPTRADLGFGPWRRQSISVESPLWCSPCSKDGSGCFRFGKSRFLCQQRISEGEISRAMARLLDARSSAGADVAFRDQRAAASSGAPAARAYRTLMRLLSRGIRFLLEALSLGRRSSWNWRRQSLKLPLNGARLIWLHAASAGELEMLWPLAEEFERQGYGLALSVFSPSGQLGVERFRDRFLPQYAGPSPWEGEWKSFFDERLKVRPAAIVTSKYEAWPELWGTAAEFHTPVFIINADDRPSLRLASRWVPRLFGRAPELHLSTIDEASKRRLESASLHRGLAREPAVLGDPRWDRVAARLSDGSVRARALFGQAARAGFSRPWMVVGSAWPEDLRFLLPEIRRIAPGLTLWVVPHAVQGKAFEECLEVVRSEWPGQWLRSSSWQEGARPAAGLGQLVVVDELGVLVELYAQAGLAWVGGGFRTGLHSVIEPALAGIPVACGPWGARRFPEVSALEATGQLRVVEDAASLGDWLDFALSPRSGQAQVWKDAYQIGAGRRCADWILQAINGSR